MLNRYASVLAIVTAFFISSTSHAAMIDIEPGHQEVHNHFYKPYDVMAFADSRMNQEIPWRQKQNFSHVSQEMEITTVPVPAAAWLFISGLMGLLTVSRRKKEHAKG